MQIITQHFRTVKLAVMLLAMVSTGTKVFAQQDPAYSFFMYNGTAINPAVAGSSDTFSGTAIYRNQWAGIKGAPETLLFSMDSPVKNRKIGLGFSIVNDKIGVTENLNINAQYAYRIQMQNGTLAMGLQAGMNNYQADYTSVVTDPANSNDKSFSENTNRMIFNFGSGIYFYNERFYAGLSVPHILNQKLDGIQDPDGIQSHQYRHYYVNAGYVFNAGENFKIKPSALVKLAEGAPLQFDINSNFWYKEFLCFGLSYRTNDSFTTLMQIQIKNIRIGYAYDFITSSLSRYTTGNNELMIHYQLPKKNKKILSPRYF
jgi:type IX secretion system PorP/SprF family membrane protein